MEKFNVEDLKKLYKPNSNSSKTDNGQVIIIGGSKLFHGAPIFALKTASRISDMVYFASSEKSVGYVAEQIKSKLLSFIWVPWGEVDEYVEKSDAVLIGPGFMRAASEDKNKKHIENPEMCDDECQKTREITKRFLSKFENKKWVIDAGSLQVMDADWIPEGAIITPNEKEFEKLFNKKPTQENIVLMAKKYKCVIVAKGPETIVCNGQDCMSVGDGNAGLTKGGTGDVLAGLTAALFAKNDSLLAASSASYISKAAANELYEEVGSNFNSDDLADKIPSTFWRLLKKH